MNCPQCGRPMTAARDDHLYAECGLATVVLDDVERHDCATCREQLVAIPCVEELHRAIALALVRKRSRLTPREVRFLRKYLGWSGPEFARYVFSTPELVARWEDPDATASMPELAERLVRLMVSTTSPEGTLSPAALLEVGVAEREPTWLRMERAEQGWRRQAD